MPCATEAMHRTPSPAHNSRSPWNRVASAIEKAVPRRNRKTAVITTMAVTACSMADKKDKSTPRRSATSLASM